MIFETTRVTRSDELIRIFGKRYGYQRGSYTLEEIMECFFDEDGNAIEYEDGCGYEICRVYGYDERRRKWYHRAAEMILTIPFIILLPLIWITTGEFGLNPNTKFAKYIRRIIRK